MNHSCQIMSLICLYLPETLDFILEREFIYSDQFVEGFYRDMMLLLLFLFFKPLSQVFDFIVGFKFIVNNCIRFYKQHGSL